MTISSQINKITHIGNGITTQFAVPFYFLEASHLEVYQLLNDIQTTPTNYSVDGVKNQSGGTIIFETAPVSGAEILIMRSVPMTQEVDYQENEIFPAETHEMTLDKLTMGLQQLSERMDRAVTVDVFSDEDTSELLSSIKSSVSTAAQYATTATEQAEVATEKVALATEQADVATQKAEELSEAIQNIENLKDASNFTSLGKENISSLGLPSHQTEIISFPQTGDTFIAPANGYISLAAYSLATAQCIQMNGFNDDGTNLIVCSNGLLNDPIGIFMPMKKNQKVEFFITTTGSPICAQFTYLEGVATDD